MLRTRNIFILVILTISFINCFSRAQVQEVKEKYDCSHAVLRAAKGSMKAITACNKELKEKYNKKEYADNVACLMKCMLSYGNVSNADNSVTEASLMTAMTKYFPEVMAEEIRIKMFEPCKTEISQLDPSEEACKSYGKFSMCMQSGLEVLINTSEYCLPRKKKPA